MEENVLYGTGRKAFLSGYRVGGKTATAEKTIIKKEDMIKKISFFIFVCFSNQ